MTPSGVMALAASFLLGWRRIFRFHTVIHDGA